MLSPTQLLFSSAFGAAAAAAVAQAATTVRDSRAARLGLATTPAATAAPAVVALDGPAVMVPMVAPESAPEMEMAPETAPGMAGAPAVMAEQGPSMMDMMAPAMAPGNTLNPKFICYNIIKIKARFFCVATGPRSHPQPNPSTPDPTPNYTTPLSSPAMRMGTVGGISRSMSRHH